MANNSFCRVEARAWKMPAQAFVALFGCRCQPKPEYFANRVVDRVLQCYSWAFGSTVLPGTAHDGR